MELAKVKVTGVHAQLVSAEDIPRGIIGATVSIVYEDPVWEGLDKTVVFRGAVTVDVLHAGEKVVIPPEVTAHTWTNLQMGIYGMDPEGKTAIPTLWVDLGRIHRAADPCGDPGSGQVLPLWAQLIAMIGDPEELNTQDKSSLVAAINELAANSGEVDASTIARLVEEYLAENPPAAGLPKITAEAEGKYLRVENGVAVWGDLQIPEQYGLVTYDQDKTITIT